GVNKYTFPTYSNRRVKTNKNDKWMPQKLNDNQKSSCFEVSSSLILRNKNELFLVRFVTCDE
ncbi:hypothetical protein Angca_010061, partial [Angiostrongylus cantonensis]